jgi:hypothetical protein
MGADESGRPHRIKARRAARRMRWLAGCESSLYCGLPICGFPILGYIVTSRNLRPFVTWMGERML